MIETLAISVVYLSFLCLIFGAWVLICNERTYRDRLRLIEDASCAADDLIVLGREWRGTFEAVRRVPYERHLWARVFFRDVSKLYELGT